ncbi:MAG: YncE family protein [Thermoleophilaceae bacterium]|nr:YncE family protein [Thermoleophilaceae bacterium]
MRPLQLAFFGAPHRLAGTRRSPAEEAGRRKRMSPWVGIQQASQRRTVVALASLCAAVGAASAQAAPSVYVANGGGTAVSQYRIGAAGLLSPFAPATVLAGNSPFWVVITLDGRDAYVTNMVDNTVSHFDVSSSGMLVAKPPVLGTGNTPLGLAVSPNGRNIYVANTGSNTISQYDVRRGGGLKAKTPATVAAGGQPAGAAVSPDGRTLYVGNAADSTVSQYDVGADGALSPKSPATVPTGNTAADVEVAPNGETVYVSNRLGNTVSQYAVGRGGRLSALSPATVAAGSGPEGMVISPDGRSLYLASARDNTVLQFSVGRRGALAPKSPASLTVTGFLPFPADAAISPDGKSVYVTNRLGGTLSQFDVGGGGKLSAKSPETVTAEALPVGLAATPAQLPAIEQLTTVPRRFPASRHTAFRFTLTGVTTAKVKITITRPGSRRVGAFKHAARAGVNRIRFSGRLGARALEPGRYRATVVATGPSGKRSQPETTSFKITAG